jgi:pimeloyl-ACP methyl ester carboxylesterase
MQHVSHQYASVDGLRLFYRESGSRSDATVLLLHGSPSSSISFRYVLAELSDRWHLIAPDLPAFGFTDIGDNASYSFTFDNLATTIGQFLTKLRFEVFAVYLHDYGAQVGFRLLANGILHPNALIIQNSEAYHGIGWRSPMWGVEERLRRPPEEARKKLLHALLSKDGIRREFLEELPDEIAIRVDPAIIDLGYNKIARGGTEAMMSLLMDYGSNIEHYSKVQACLRAGAYPTLLLWGKSDQYLAPEAAEAYKDDLPNAELQFCEGGHWLLETHFQEVNSALRTFLSKHT